MAGRLALIVAAGTALAGAQPAAAERVAIPPEVGAAVQAGDAAKALTLVEPALAACQARPSSADQCLMLLVAQADILARLRRFDAAEGAARRALAITDQVAGPSSADSVGVLAMLNAILSAAMQPGRQLPLLERQYAILQERAGPLNPQTVMTAVQLAAVLSVMGRTGDAEALLTPVATRLRAATDGDKVLFATVLQALGSATIADPVGDKPERYYREAWQILEGATGDRSPPTLMAMMGLATVLSGRDKTAEALALATRVVTLGGDAPPSAGAVISALTMLTTYATRTRDYAAAERHALAGLALSDRVFGPSAGGARTLRGMLAMCYAEQNRHAEAEPIFRKLIEEAGQAGDAPPIERAYYQNGLAIALSSQGRYAEAEPLYRAAIARMRAQLAAESPALTWGYAGLGWALMRQARLPAEARTLFRLAAAASMAKLSLRGDFDEAAQVDLRRQAPVFTAQVAVAWQLGGAAR